MILIFQTSSLKVILENNPEAKIYANSSVSELLKTENIPHKEVKNGDVISLGKISVVGIGEKHAMMHSSIPQSANLGFFIGGRFWYSNS